LFEAVRLATLNPARIAKVDQRIGSLAVGKEATLLRLDKNLALKQLWQRGQLRKVS
ncbi:amidohydrolase family protein, partial [bacterium]|nr:amidohydrolase family protein [bacterium]